MKALLKHNVPLLVLAILVLSALGACRRQPPLHLHDNSDVEVEVEFSLALSLDVYWDYELEYGARYDWKSEWIYGWDATDSAIFGGPIGYIEPTKFVMRRYFTDNVAYGPHKYVLAEEVNGYRHAAKYAWGFWDILVWNEIEADVQSVILDETSTLEYVTAYTNETMHAARYNRTRSHSFYQPDQLYSGYMQALEINEDMDGFDYDTIRGVYVKNLQLILEPVTYIYLVQVILYNNNGRITNVDGGANLSGMAHEVRLNNGVTGPEPITVYYNMRLKHNLNKDGKPVDVIGGRVQTFGMCNLNPNRVRSRTDGKVTRVDDGVRHYVDVNMQFVNGKDSTLIFDLTDKVQELYKGGVLTVEIDCDTLKMPAGKKGSGFNATVEDFEDGGTHEIEL